MNRKWAVLAIATVSAALMASGFSFARDDDEETPLHKVMEKVQAENIKITKGVRNAAMFKKSQKDVVTAAENLVKLGKEAKPMTDTAKNNKEVEKPVEKWNTLMDAFLKEAEDFSKKVGSADQPKAKDDYKKVSRACTNCHDVFRVEEE